MLKSPVQKMGNVYDPQGNFSRHLETVRKNQMEKHIDKDKEWLWWLNNRFDTAEEIISELKDRSK